MDICLIGLEKKSKEKRSSKDNIHCHRKAVVGKHANWNVEPLRTLGKTKIIHMNFKNASTIVFYSKTLLGDGYQGYPYYLAFLTTNYNQNAQVGSM